MENRDFQVELLYFGHGETISTNRHCHPYFQLESCVSGQLIGIGGGKKWLLNPGDCWLIPAGMMHKFAKSSGKTDYVSIKFTTSAALGSKVVRDRACQYLLEQIRAIIDDETVFSPYSVDSKFIIENCLRGILRCFERESASDSPSKFLTDLQAVICELGAASNIDDLAERFHLTRAEFRYRFSKETGSGNIKSYIDNILLNLIEQHMRYSNISLNKIAQQMNFSSIYAFSRYYRHKRGITLSEFRNGTAKP